MKYRKKPVVVEAVQWNGANYKQILEFTHGTALRKQCACCLNIPTLEGDMNADVHDFIIKGVNGEFYPCKPDIFEKTYDAVE